MSAVVDPTAAGDHLILTGDGAATFERIRGITVCGAGPRFCNRDQDEWRQQSLNNFTHQLCEPVPLTKFTPQVEGVGGVEHVPDARTFKLTVQHGYGAFPREKP